MWACVSWNQFSMWLVNLQQEPIRDSYGFLFTVTVLTAYQPSNYTACNFISLEYIKKKTGFIKICSLDKIPIKHW